MLASGIIRVGWLRTRRSDGNPRDLLFAAITVIVMIGVAVIVISLGKSPCEWAFPHFGQTPDRVSMSALKQHSSRLYLFKSSKQGGGGEGGLHMHAFHPQAGLGNYVIVPARAQLSEVVRRARDERLRTIIGNVSTVDDAGAAFNPTEPEDDSLRSSVRTLGGQGAVLLSWIIAGPVAKTGHGFSRSYL